MGEMELGKLEEFKGGRCTFMKEIENLCLKLKKSDGDLSGKGDRKVEKQEKCRRVERENVRKKEK